MSDEPRPSVRESDLPDFVPEQDSLPEQDNPLERIGYTREESIAREFLEITQRTKQEPPAIPGLPSWFYVLLMIAAFLFAWGLAKKLF